MGKRINVLLFLEDVDRIERYLKERGSSRSGFIREALAIYDGFKEVRIKNRKKKNIPVYFSDLEFKDLQTLKKNISFRYGIDVKLSDLIRLAVHDFLNRIIAKQ